MELLEKDVQDTLLVKPFNVGAHLRLSTPFVVQPNIRSCLFAISNQFGWAIIGIQSFENHQSGPAFILTQVETLTKSLQNAEPHANTWITPQDAHLTIPISSFCDPNSVVLTHLAFAASDRLVVAATSDGTLSIFSLQNLISKTNITPLRQFIAHSNIPVQALIPNPAPGGTFSAFIAVVYADSRIRVLDLYDVQKVHWEAQSITAAEWSPMGKRLIVGYKDGKLEYFTHDGQSKGVIEAPTQAEGMEVLHIKWIDQKDYIITFCEQVAKEGFEELATETFALHVKKQTVPIDSSFRSCPDPTPAQGVLDTSPNRLMTRLPTCSPATWRHLIIVALSNSTELGIIGFEDAPEPSLLILSEDHRLEIPSSEESYEPASPLGVAATFSTPTSSIIWSYTTDGVLSLWNTQLSTPEGQGNPPVWLGPPMDQEVLSRDSGINSPPADQSKSPGSNRPDRTAAPEQQTTDLGPPASTSSEFPSAQATPVSAFGQPSQGTAAFGQTAFGQQSAFGPSAFGQSAFGTQSQPASISVFGAGNATFGPPAPTGAVAPASASLSGSQTAFGQSPFGQSAFGQSAFGQSTFGTKPLSASTSAFGTGQNSFGQSTSTSTVIPASTPFSSGPTAFGQSGFGSSAFGQSAFGQTAFGTKSQSANTSVFGAGQATQAGSTSTLVPASTSFSGSSSTTPVGFAAFANASSTKTAQETAGASTSGSNNTGGFAQFNNGSASLQLGAGLLADSSSSTGNIFGASTSTPSSTTNNPVTPAVWGASDNSNSTLQRPSFATPIHSFSGTSTSNGSLSFAAMSGPRNNVSFGQLRGSSTSPPQTQAEVTETNSTPPSPIIPSSDNVTTEDVPTSELASASTDEPAEISFSGLQFDTSTSLGTSAQTTVNTQEIADSDSDQEGSELAPSSPIASPEQNVASDLPTPSSPDMAANSSLSALQVDHTSSLESSETLEASQTTGDETEEPEAPAGQEVAPVPHSSPSISTASEVETTNISGGPEPALSSEIASEERNAAATNEVPTSFSSSSNEELPSTQPLTSPSSPQTTCKETEDSRVSVSQEVAQVSDNAPSAFTPLDAETGDISGVPKPTLSNAIASDEGNAATINDDENTLPTTPASSKIINKIGSPLRNELSLPSTPTPASPRSPKPTAETPKSGALSSPGFEQFSTTESTFSTPSKSKAGAIFGESSPTLLTGTPSDEETVGSVTTAIVDTPPASSTLPATPSSSKVFATIGSPLRNELLLPSTPTPASPRSSQATAETQKSGASASPGFGQFASSGSSSFSTPAKGVTVDDFGSPKPTSSNDVASDEGNAATADGPQNALPESSSSKVLATVGSPLRNELTLPSTPKSPSPQPPLATAVSLTPGLGTSTSQGFGQFSGSGSSFSTPSKGDTADIFGNPKPTLPTATASDEGNAATTKAVMATPPGSASSSKVPATFGSSLKNELTLPSTSKSPSPKPPQTTAVTQGFGASASRGFGQFSGSASTFSTPSKDDKFDIFGNPKPTLPTATTSDEGNAATTKAVMATPPGSASSSKVSATFGSSLKNELTLPSTLKSPSPQPPQTTAVTQGFGASASRGFGQFSGSASTFSTPSKDDKFDIFGNPKPNLPTSDEGNTATTKAVMATPPGSASSSEVFTTFGSSLKNELTLPSTSKSPSPQPPQTTAVTQGFGASASRGFGQFSGSASSFSTPAKGNAGNIFGASAEQNADTTKHNPNSFAGSSSFFKASNSFNSPSNNELSFSQHRGSPRSLEDSRADAVPSTSITPCPGVNPPLSDSGSEHSSVTGSEKSCIGKSTSSFPPSVANPGLKQSKNQAKDVSSVGQSGPFQSSSQVLNRTPHLDGVSSLKSQMPSLERTMTGLQAPSTPISRSISDPSVVASSTSSSSRVNQSVSMPAFQERTAGLETPQKSDLCGSISGQPQALRDIQAQCNLKMSFFNSPRSALADSKSLLDANPKLSGPVGITLPKLVSQENVGPSAGMQARTVGVPSSLCSSPVKAALPSITKATPPHDPKLPFSTQPATVSLPITSLDHALVPKIIASSEPEALPSIDVGIEQAILRVVDISSSTLQSLASVCHTCQSYIEGCNVPLRSPDSKTEQHTLKQWQMADLPTLSRHVNSLTEQAQTEITRLDSRCQIVRALESGVSKAELKHDEVKRILRAYNDPGYFRVLGSRQLSPVQLARQKSMRRSFQDIKLGTSQVSVALESLRSRLIGIKAGRRQMQPPFLDTINRSVHQLTQALSHHILYIHHLSSRVRALQAAQSKTNQSSLELVPHNDFTSSVHEQNQAFTESAALQALQSEHTGVRFRDAILGQRSRPVLTVPQESDSAEESALSLILPDQPIIIKPRKASAPLRSSLSYECRSPTWFNSPRLSNGRLSEGRPVSSPSLAPPPAPGSGKAGQWFGSEQITGSSGGWMRGSR